MALRTIRDPRLSSEQNQTNVLGQQQIEENDKENGITGVPRPITTSQAAQQQPQDQASQQQAQQQAQQQTGAGASKQPARSGMFTNIKQYLEKNKPVVQQMGTQAGKQFATEAEKTQLAARKQAEEYQKNIAGAAAGVASQIQAGKKAIEDIVNAPPVQPTAEETTSSVEETPVKEAPTIEDYVKAAQQATEGVSNLDLSSQAKEAMKLQQQASGILSQAGRRDLLRDIFGAKGRQYTRGSQALDALLLSQDPLAGKALQTEVQKASVGLEKNLEEQQRKANTALLKVKELAGRAGQDLDKYSQESISELEKIIESQRQESLADRDRFIKGNIAEIENAINQVESEFENKIPKENNMEGHNSFFDSLGIVPRIINQGQGRKFPMYEVSESDLKKAFDNQNLGLIFKDFETFRDLILPKGVTSYNFMITPDYTEKAVKESTQFLDNIRTYLAANKFNKDMGKINYEVSSKYKRDEKGNLIVDNEGNPVLNEDFVPYIDPRIAKEIEKQTGINYKDFVLGSDIEEGKYYGFSKNELDKINAIRRMRGEPELQLSTRDYATSEEIENFNFLKDLVNKYARKDIPL